MKKLRGIIFDKDGTLIDYYSVWGPVFRHNITSVLQQLGRSGDAELEQEMLKLLGITDSGVYPKGLVFGANSSLMLIRMWIFARKWKLSFRNLLQAFRQAFYGSRDMLAQSLTQANSTGDLHRLFRELKERDYKIGLVTGDTAESTKLCLEQLGIIEYFDFISTHDDQFKNKPDPQTLLLFCRQFLINPREVAVVGDSAVDFLYAKKGMAGYSAAVLTGSNDVKKLSRMAKAVYPDLNGLFDDPVIFPKQQ